jgi:hypothetical protein
MPTAAEMVAEATKRIQNLTVDETVGEVADGALLVDISEPCERAENAAIAGVVEAPRGMLESCADPTSR